MVQNHAHVHGELGNKPCGFDAKIELGEFSDIVLLALFKLNKILKVNKIGSVFLYEAS